MAAYASLAQMLARFDELELIQLTDRDGSHGAVVESVLADALADASADIDLHLAGRYPLPLPQVPPVLVRLCCDIARYRLYDTRVTEAVRQRYQDAVRLLESLASGKTTLGLADGSDVATDDDSIELQSAGTVFGRNQGGFL